MATAYLEFEEPSNLTNHEVISIGLPVIEPWSPREPS